VKDRTPEQVKELLQKHSDHYRYEPNSRPTKDKAEDYEPSGWISEVRIWEDRGDKSIVHTQFSSRKFKSQQQADNYALYIAADWLDKNA